MYMDREFDVLVDKASAPINTTGADNHVPRIKQHIQHVKQSFRGKNVCYHKTSYQTSSQKK